MKALRVRRTGRKNSRGAVLAEFAIAVVPLLATFFSLYQVTRLQTAKLMVTNAAICGARTASVTSNAHGNNPGAPAHNNALPERAVKAALAPFLVSGAFRDVEVDVEDSSSLADPSGPVRVTVTVKVTCAVPMMGRVICKGRHKVVQAHATMPHQGATYAAE